MGILRFAVPAPLPRCLRRQDRPFRRLPGQLLQRLRKMFAVVQQKDAPRAPLHEERDQRRVGLGGVAVTTGQDEVVRTVVRVLPATWAHMVERDRLGSSLDAAVGADGAMLGEEPFTVAGVGSA